MSDERLVAASRLLDLVCDAERLRLIGRLVEGDWTVTSLAGALRMKPQTVARHVRSLEEAGLIRRRDERAAEMTFDSQALRVAVAAVRPEGEAAAAGDDDARTLRSFVVDGRLTHLPTQRSRWLVVLSWLADQFEYDVTYPERELNEQLGAIHADHALLRRQLVDEGFMQRDHGVYWRVGPTT